MTPPGPSDPTRTVTPATGSVGDTPTADPSPGTVGDAPTAGDAADIPEASTASAVAGFEILGELGRDGMGVVYKARHLRLNRLTALKLILAGGHASAKARSRFRAEADAAEEANQPFAAAFHLRRLLDLKPDDADALRKRLAAVEARLNE
jgi:serine/threonine protein kinase